MGIVFDIQKFSVHDGPGIRTTVFLKGCNIRCKWCHNPESFKIKPQISFDSKNCTNCMACQNVCSEKVHSFVNGIHKVDYSKCIACGKCVDNCLNKAIKIFGKEMTSDEVVKEVLKDKKYYASSGGGVTISGGEPTMQLDFLLELMEKLKKEDIHICLETNGVFSSSVAEKIIKYVDLFLLDYKATGDELHKKLTGSSNELILKNLEFLHQNNKSIILRCPVIPGVNDFDEHFEAIKEIKNKYSNIINVEIMAYHSLGKTKWECLGMDYTLNELKDVEKEQKEKWISQIN